MRRLLAATALAGVVLTATACSKIGGTGDLNYINGDQQLVLVGPADRQEPLEISGTTIQGDPLDVADLRGKVVVLNVWWSGCGPCRSEMPMLVEAEDELAKDQPDQVAFVGINIRDLAPETAAAFERDRGVDYPSLYDPGSETLLDMGKYAPYAPPATLVLDREGRVAALVNGPIPSKTTLTSVVEDTLAESDG
ncbi:TlpA disulfide reductase family protein [Nocardioides daeguensis]|uniref:Thioredoxin domain-containing protein n=1 Tax=Nocardioides daeguensis TaxID=908359 RepID=A0ABP6V098_9ACTN|nr:TlpA disulfide reductase family protein [Nocardioides daeguensis]MBV6726981.1 TlpA family protein disulfide reductase [Nocardioides daeguensis]MCR1771616.1 TlpA family protein disulfide reductase [Nocardioides daeguensis]